ncbi:GerAB/ArcD/ProY family transporter [Halalkalibacter alkaliphilus]|uniref:Spore germination protein n=1 Tax=Halalkalibacter alkaliphilus TaxID=2917993 RepID=A0A9X2I7Z0_9BACI|nr:endospore germination permease [Halalkalibacter alkaliphilus]MCL7748569.1 spore germination protein [Halalkalibacter alkaliphilus]
MNKFNISASQMAILLYPTIIATGILSVPSITSQYAQNDLWLSPIFASIVGFLTVFITCQLHKQYPNDTIVQITEKVLGRFLGKVVGFFFMLTLIHTTGEITRAYSELLLGSFLLNTPLSVIMGSMLFLCAIVVYSGVEVLARVGQVFFPLFLIPLLLLVIFLIPDYNFGNTFPILEDGLVPPLLGAVVLSGWYSQFFLMIFFLPLVTDKKNGMKYGMITVACVALTLVIVNLMVLFILGPTTPSKIYPVINASRYVRVADFFDNLEAVSVTLWIIGAFVKISVFYYAATISTTHVFNLKDFRLIIWPLSIFMMIFGIWDIKSTMEYNEYINKVVPFYSPLMFTLLPLLILMIAKVRNKNEDSSGSQTIKGGATTNN